MRTTTSASDEFTTEDVTIDPNLNYNIFDVIANYTNCSVLFNGTNVTTNFVNTSYVNSGIITIQVKMNIFYYIFKQYNYF